MLRKVGRVKQIQDTPVHRSNLKPFLSQYQEALERLKLQLSGKKWFIAQHTRVQLFLAIFVLEIVDKIMLYIILIIDNTVRIHIHKIINRFSTEQSLQYTHTQVGSCNRNNTNDNNNNFVYIRRPQKNFTAHSLLLDFHGTLYNYKTWTKRIKVNYGYTIRLVLENVFQLTSLNCRGEDNNNNNRGVMYYDGWLERGKAFQ